MSPQERHSSQRTAASTLAPEPSRHASPDTANRYSPFPLTEIQQAYWLGRGSNFALGNVSTHLYWELTCSPLDLPRLERAWQAVIDRHDMLRAIILPNGQQQVLEGVPPYKIAVLDLRDRATAAVIETEALAAIRDELSHQVLPSDRWPIFELRVTRLPEADRLHLSFDGTIVDFSSVFLLLQEWGQRYENPALPLPPLTFSFRDYVLTDRASRDRQASYAKSLAYWQERLDTLPAAPALPLQKTPQEIESTGFVRREARLDTHRWQQLQERAGSHGLTPSGVLLAAYAEVLAAWSGSPQFCLNLTLLNRQPYHPQVGELVGDFTSLLLLAVDNSAAGESFLQRARGLQRQFRRDLRHRRVDGMGLLRELARRRNATHVPMPVVFTSLLGRAFAGTAAGVAAFGEVTYGITQTPQVWLDCQVMERQGILHVSWDAVEDLFPPRLLDDMFAAFSSLLADLAAGDRPWTDTAPRNWLPASQRRQRTAANATTVPLTEPLLLHEGFAARAQQQPQAPAIVADDGEIDYGTLATWSNRIGGGLQQRGLQRGELVAIVAAKSTAQVAGVLGILAAGGAYVPIDPDWPAARQWELLAEAGIRFVLTQGSLRDRLAWPETVCCLCLDVPAEWAIATDAPLETDRDPAELAYVIYTSGSTGKPKGVAISHRSAANTLIDINRRFAIGPQDKILGLSALSFDLSVYDIFGTLAAGGTLVLPGACQLREPGRWLETIREHGITLWNSVPALLQMLVDRLEATGESAPLSLRLALLSGDWLSPALPERLRAYCPEARIVSLGGATEAAIWSIYHPVTTVAPERTSIPYGKPLANQRFYVLDKDLSDRPDWVPGQLYIGGTGLAREYWNDPEKTAASFIWHPQTGERLYKTGDLGRYWPDGSIEFLGRADTQVKINGFRVEIGEVEARLTRHPGIKDAVVTAATVAGGSKQLAAHLVLEPSGAADNLWQTQTAPQERACQWQHLVASGLDRARDLPAADAAALASLHGSLERLHQEATCRALRQLGFFRRAGEQHTVASLLESGAIAARYECWLQRSLTALVRCGWLETTAAGFASSNGLPEVAIDFGTPQHWSQRVWGLTAAESEGITAAAGDLAAILAERTHSGELYARGTTPAIYQKLFGASHAIARAALEAVARPQRVLEIGAGYGSLTQHLLPVLAQQPTPPEYWFTDISNFFQQQGRTNFAHYPAMEYATFNFDRDPAQQGLPRHGFNVIVAASALHVARDLKTTLAYLRSLLAPGGVLLLIEETQFFPWFDLLMGLQQGFENFRDRALRPEHPLLSRAGWTQVLEAAGFGHCTYLGGPGTTGDALGFDVLAARGPLEVRQFDSQPLQQFLQQYLPSYMLPARYAVLDALPLSANGKVDRRALTTTLPTAPATAASQPPQTDTERTLARIWADILQAEAIDRGAHFFALGGDSLLAARAISQIQQTWGVEIPFGTFFQAPTLKDLAVQIETRQNEAVAYEEIEL